MHGLPSVRSRPARAHRSHRTGPAIQTSGPRPTTHPAWRSTPSSGSSRTEFQEACPSRRDGERLVQIVPSLVFIELVLESGPIPDPTLRVAQMALRQGLVHGFRDRRRPIGGPVLTKEPPRVANRSADFQPSQASEMTSETSRQLVEKERHFAARLRLQAGNERRGSCRQDRRTDARPGTSPSVD